MPINTEHPEYTTNKVRWKRCRDVLAGEDAVKLAGDLYLPKLSSHIKKPREYEAYKTRALFYGATGRTMEAMLGAVFRKDPAVEPESDYIRARCRNVVEEVLATGRVGVLVDVPMEGGDPYLVVYTAEQVVNWRYTVHEDNKVLELVVLKEVRAEPKSDDLYALEDVTYYRVLEVEEGTYKQSLYKEHQGKTRNQSSTFDIVNGFPVFPEMRGAMLAEIPFMLLGPKNNDPDVDNPPLLDLANVNLSHYRTSADIEHGRHFTALPTAWVAGFDQNTVLEVGSGTAWVTEKTDAKAGFLEFTGQGLRALETAMTEKQNLMANLGARMFDTGKAGVESEGALRIRSASETATLSGIIANLSDGLTTVYQWYNLFLPNGVQNAGIKLNNDLVDINLNAQDLAALVSAWQMGAISQDTLLYNLKQGEILPNGRTVDDERQQIEIEVGALRDRIDELNTRPTGE